MMLKSLRLVPFLALASASPAAAQKGGLLTPSGGLAFWTVLTFLVVLAALWKFAWPHILGAVEAREEHIRDLLAAAKQDREAARALLEEQTAKTEAVRASAQELVAEGRLAGERMRDEIISRAREEQQELLDRTRRDIHQEMERAIGALRIEVVDLTIAAASKLVETNLDTEDNRRLVREFLMNAAEPAPAGVGAGA